MYACENVCDIRANGAYACQCKDTFPGALSASCCKQLPFICRILHHILTFLFRNTTINVTKLPWSTEARSQVNSVMVHPLRVQLAALHCIHAIYFLIQLEHIR